MGNTAAEAIKSWVRAFKREVTVYRAVLKDRRTPLIAKVFLWAALAYVCMPFDLIPDWIPILGIVDDFVIVPGLVGLAVLFLPKGLVAEHRAAVLAREGQVRPSP